MDDRCVEACTRAIEYEFECPCVRRLSVWECAISTGKQGPEVFLSAVRVWDVAGARGDTRMSPVSFAEVPERISLAGASETPAAAALVNGPHVGLGCTSLDCCRSMRMKTGSGNQPTVSAAAHLGGSQALYLFLEGLLEFCLRSAKLPAQEPKFI